MQNDTPDEKPPPLKFKDPRRVAAGKLARETTLKRQGFSARHQRRLRVTRLPNGLTPRQEKFCQLIAAGYSLRQASQEAGYAGTPDNASRRANQPNMAARIREIREELVVSREIRKDLLKETVEKQFSEDVINIQWLISEARMNLELARASADTKAANDCLKLIAELTGHLKGAKGRDTDPNRTPSRDNSLPAPQVNLQIINRLSEQMGGGGGGLPEEGYPLLEATTVDAAPVDATDGSGSAVAGPPKHPGHDAAELSKRVADRVAEELELLRGVHDAG